MGNRAEITEHACSIELFKMEDAKGVGAHTKEEKKSIFYFLQFDLKSIHLVSTWNQLFNFLLDECKSSNHVE